MGGGCGEMVFLVVRDAGVALSAGLESFQLMLFAHSEAN